MAERAGIRAAEPFRSAAREARRGAERVDLYCVRAFLGMRRFRQLDNWIAGTIPIESERHGNAIRALDDGTHGGMGNGTRGETEKTSRTEDGTEIACSNDVNNVLNFQFD